MHSVEEVAARRGRGAGRFEYPTARARGQRPATRRRLCAAVSRGRAAISPSGARPVRRRRRSPRAGAAARIAQQRLGTHQEQTARRRYARGRRPPRRASRSQTDQASRGSDVGLASAAVGQRQVAWRRAVNGRIAAEGVPATGWQSTRRPYCGRVATTARPAARSSRRRGIADRDEAAIVNGQGPCRAVVAAGEDDRRGRRIERQAEAAQALRDGGRTGRRRPGASPPGQAAPSSGRGRRRAARDPRFQIGVDREAERAPQRQRFQARFLRLALRARNRPSGRRRYAPRQPRRARRPRAGRAGQRVAVGGHLTTMPPYQPRGLASSAAMACSAWPRGVPVTITGAAVAAIASQASAPVRSVPASRSTACTTVASDIGRGGPASAGPGSHSGARSLRSASVQTASEAASTSSLISSRNDSASPTAPGRRATVPQTGSASTSPPATTSCRSGDAPNRHSPAPSFRKKLAGAGLAARSRAQRCAQGDLPRRLR